jgi:hypothetical protein
MRRRLFLRHLSAAGASLAWRPDPLVRWLRGLGGWSARLDDPAFGGRGDGVQLNDEPLLQALADMPAEGGTLIIPPAGAWLFDAVDLARVGRAHATLVATGARLAKSARTASHLFRDEHGSSNGLAVVGGTYDLARASFRPGQTVSAFFLVRADDVSFTDVTVHDGIEEGLKLYTPRRLRVRGGAFERLVNNGVQIHAPEHDGFRGDAPERDTSDVLVEGAIFRDVDDGLHGGEGQGVSVSGASARITARGVRVTGCTFERCVRGAWAEFNQPGVQGVDIRFERNRVVSSDCHGLGLVGVRDGALIGNHVLDTGRIVPGRPGVASSETAGIVVSGSPRTLGEDNVVEDNEVVDRRTGPGPRMQFGILVRRQRGLVERRNVVRGATIEAVRLER